MPKIRMQDVDDESASEMPRLFGQTPAELAAKAAKAKKEAEEIEQDAAAEWAAWLDKLARDNVDDNYLDDSGEFEMADGDAHKRTCELDF